MPERFRVILVAAVLLAIAALLVPLRAEARLDGLVELGYIYFKELADVQEKTRVNQFIQRYSLLYSTEGVLTDGRLGQYRLAAGYEWAAVNSTIDQTATESQVIQRAGHFLYDVDVFIDPRELPLKLRVFSHNNRPILFKQDSTRYTSWRSWAYTRIFEPGLITDISDGTAISSGATLVLGTKGGMSNGYNTIFNEIPAILVDYRDDIQKDLNSFTPVDTRLKRLSFVSLNKRENWFHYRTTDYSDNINPWQNYKDTQVQLGTVDQGMMRRWLDVTNWLQISTDGVYTRHRETGQNLDLYEFNLFAIATQPYWEVRNFNYFNRRIDSQGILSYEQRVPLYASGTWGPDMDWRARLSYDNITSPVSLSNSYNRSDLLASWQSNMFKRAAFMVTPTLDLENYSDEFSSTLMFGARVETISSRRFSDQYTLYGGYSIRYYHDDRSGLYNAINTILNRSSDYVLQKITGRVSYQPTPLFRYEAGEDLTIATGDRPSQGSSLNPNVDYNRTIAGNTYNQSPLGPYVRSVTTGRGEWLPDPRVRLSLSGTVDALMEEGRRANILYEARHTTNCSLRDLSLTVDVVYQYQTIGSTYNSNWFSSNVVGNYTPNRTMAFSLSSQVYLTGGNHQPHSTSYNLLQSYNYYFYTVNGMSRRLLELNETVEYWGGSYGIYQPSTARLYLGFKYYPISRLLVGGLVRLSLLDPGSNEELMYNFNVGLNYQKLQATLDYTYGVRSGTDNRKEQRFAVNVKKFF